VGVEALVLIKLGLALKSLVISQEAVSMPDQHRKYKFMQLHWEDHHSFVKHFGIADAEERQKHHHRQPEELEEDEVSLLHSYLGQLGILDLVVF